MNFAQLKQPDIRPTLALTDPQTRRTTLTAFDSDLLFETVRDAGFEHRQLQRGPFRGELVRTEVGGLAVDGGHYSQSLLVRGSFSPTRVTVGIPLSDREPGYVNGMRLRAHDLAVFPEGGELDYVLPADTEWCTVQLERHVLLAAGIPEDSIGRMSVIPPQPGQHARLARLMRSALDGDVSPQAQYAFRDALLEELYQAMDPQRKQCRCAYFRNRADLIRRFERLVDEEGAERRSVAELAQALGVGRRTLEQAFSDYVGLSPARYLAAMRLNAVRRELLRASEDNLGVGDLAKRHGIGELGRFAGAYRQMFGELPSQTLGRARRRAP